MMDMEQLFKNLSTTVVDLAIAGEDNPLCALSEVLETFNGLIADGENDDAVDEIVCTALQSINDCFEEPEVEK